MLTNKYKSKSQLKDKSVAVNALESYLIDRLILLFSGSTPHR